MTKQEAETYMAVCRQLVGEHVVGPLNDIIEKSPEPTQRLTRIMAARAIIAVGSMPDVYTAVEVMKVIALGYEEVMKELKLRGYDPSLRASELVNLSATSTRLN